MMSSRLTRRLQPTHRQKQRWAAEAGSLGDLNIT